MSPARSAACSHGWRRGPKVATRYRKLVVVLALATGLFSFLDMDKAEETTVPQVYVHARRYSFIPAQITLKKGQTAKLILLTDDVTHGLAVKGLGIRADIVKGHRTEILVTPAQIGDYPGSCSVYCGSGHRDMELLVRVVE